ncbi:class I SAM-dependent methyltransferase [Actinopolyspora mzabensis]|nr:class I SAM-dependent methyltransferase [Actinopolyspora mzabensis]
MAGLGERLAERGFAHPRGLFGRLGGRLMSRGNAATEREVVALAEPNGRDEVLVVGPGPGVGVQTAARCARRVVGVDPSDLMLEACRLRCADQVKRGRVRLVRATAERTGQPDGSFDVVLSVNNVQLWPDRHEALVELARVLRPGGRLVLSAHERWLAGGLRSLHESVVVTGFTDVSTRTWQPPSRGTPPAAQLCARLP